MTETNAIFTETPVQRPSYSVAFEQLTDAADTAEAEQKTRLYTVFDKALFVHWLKEHNHDRAMGCISMCLAAGSIAQSDYDLIDGILRP